MNTQKLPRFLAGDIAFCHDKGDRPGLTTAWTTRSRGESPTFAVHTAQFIDAGTVIEMGPPGITRTKSTAEFLSNTRAIQIWRDTSLTELQRRAVSRKAWEYVGRKFGWGKLFTHLLDGLVSKFTPRPVFFFRHLNHDQRYPICSWITAFSYDRAISYRFGCHPEGADPDQIHDWVSSHPEEWSCVYFQAERVHAPQPVAPGGMPRGHAVGSR